MCIVYLDVGICVWTMWGHCRVETRTTCIKSLLLGIVYALDVAHELRHAVSVVIGWFEGVFLYQPSGWENDEIETGSSLHMAATCQHSEYGWVGMVK